MTHRELLREAFQRHGLSDEQIKLKLSLAPPNSKLNLDDQIEFQPGVDMAEAKEQMITSLLEAFRKLDADPRLRKEVMDICKKQASAESQRN